jgi:nicotinamide-nucleotide amidase
VTKPYCWRVDAQALETVTRLTAAGATLATAESLTGGLLGAVITTVPGASAVYRGGVVAYATEVKVGLLGVPQDLVDEYGVVSAECAERMAVEVRSRTGSSYALSTTGVAGPDEQEGQPVGTVFVGMAGPGGPRTARLELVGDRQRIREGACAQALALLLDSLDREETFLG